MKKPQKAVVVLLDSLNRHMLGSYGGHEFETPNLDRFAKRAISFTNHYTGSLPCIPARHDILVGAMDFLWRPWGSIELWERPITYHLRRKGIPTMLFSDHPHLFETGGENYHTDFMAWEYLRGHESDPWKTREDPSWAGSPTLPAGSRGKMAGSDNKAPYDLSRTWFREELDFPGPKTMQATADWLEQNATIHDSFLLFVDEFDPHEPFDTPAPWNRKYDPEWQDELIIWPPYAIGGVERGIITAREGQHVRANYGAKLSMIDHWFGKVLDVMDRDNLWLDTLFIVCTDHGHYLGEKDLWGKPGVPQYETLGHTPLMIAAPGIECGEVPALTTNVDINATLVDLFDTEIAYVSHGKSLLPLVYKQVSSIREWAIGGIFGQWVQIQDGKNKYMRAPVDDGFPLSMWSNRWSTMPISGLPNIRLPNPDKRAYLDFMPDSEIPVIRQPFRQGDLLPYWSLNPQINDHHLYKVNDDPEENENRVGEPLEKDMQDLLRHALEEMQAPGEQIARLGL
ncbi:MAG: sulfatase [Gammaproteobacteria bacterium]|nr:sulfatase [Gammaproteobacteria bacterium]